jgi:choloylglycine hydrolase
MIGLPGDFTPPSRFVRAVAFTQTARVTHDGEDAICELFRILDNFNVPLGVVEAAGGGKARGMLSSTLWTSGYDLKNKVLYYHTQHNRRIRRLDLKKIDFTTGAELTRMPMDKVKAQDFEDVLPTGK